MSSETDPLAEAIPAIFGENSLLKPHAEQFGKSLSDALAKYGTRWFWNRANELWKSGHLRVSGSGRIPWKPRRQAVIEITKHGAAEERPELREAYENLAARAMTEDEWEHDYEEYARKLSALLPGDIRLLHAIYAAEKDKYAREAGSHGPENNSTFTPQSHRISEIAAIANLDGYKLMGAVDRLEENNLLQIRPFPKSGGVAVHPPQQDTRIPGLWFKGTAVDISSFLAALTALGVELIEHVTDLEPQKETAAT